MAKWVEAQLIYENAKENVTPDGNVVDGRPLFQARENFGKF